MNSPASTFPKEDTKFIVGSMSVELPFCQKG